MCLATCQNTANWRISNMGWGGWVNSTMQPAFCRACHWSCATCITQTFANNTCLTCSDTAERENRKVRNIINTSTGASECLSGCPVGTVENTVTSTCENCAVLNCGDCPTIDVCNSCKSGFFLDASTDPVNRTCHATCPAGQHNTTLS